MNILPFLNTIFKGLIIKSIFFLHFRVLCYHSNPCPLNPFFCYILRYECEKRMKETLSFLNNCCGFRGKTIRPFEEPVLSEILQSLRSFRMTRAKDSGWQHARRQGFKASRIQGVEWSQQKSRSTKEQKSKSAEVKSSNSAKVRSERQQKWNLCNLKC